MKTFDRSKTNGGNSVDHQAMQQSAGGVKGTAQRSASPAWNGPMTPAQLKELQGIHGNHAVSQFLAAQRKAAAGLVQREALDLEEEIQQKAENPAQRAEMEDDELQLKSAKPLQRKDSSAGKLPESIKSPMESTLGADFSGVNIHVGQQATDVGALAYTQGEDIHFAPGMFKPDTQQGQQLIGHELTHVVQQREGRVQATGSVGDMPLNDNPGLEGEADQNGNLAASQIGKTL